MTIGARQYVVAWMLFHLGKYLSVMGPVIFRELIEEIESNLVMCDAFLAKEYDEYEPQKVD